MEMRNKSVGVQHGCKPIQNSIRSPYFTHVSKTLGVRCFALNHLGTPVVVSDLGTTTQVIKRDEWGSILTNNFDKNLVTNTSIGYTNQKQDQDTGLTYDHARYLSNLNRVWLSEDPMALNNFSSEIMLSNPQMQNSYSYSTNDPINMVDEDGRIPSAIEAAYMARDIYPTNRGMYNIPGGWKLQDVASRGDNMIMGVYSRYSSKNAAMEFAFVYKGTSDAIDWKNNGQQPFGLSPDALGAIDAPSEYIRKNKRSEFTTVGHSKGGAEAALAAIYYNLNSIIFNPATAYPLSYNMDIEQRMYSKQITNYTITGEILSRAIGVYVGKNISVVSLNPVDWTTPNVGTSFGLSTSKTTKTTSSNFNPKNPLTNSVQNHSMDAIIKSLSN